MSDPNPNPSPAPNPAPNPTPAPTPEVKTYTQEEFDKAMQSASSKGKNEILAAFGVKTVEEGKEKIAKHAELSQVEVEFKDLQTKHATLLEENTKLLDEKTKAEKDALLRELGIESDGAELFLKLLETETEGTLLERGTRVKEKLVKMLAKEVKFGATKTPASDPTLQEEFKKMRKL